jgi:hypothetical protein
MKQCTLIFQRREGPMRGTIQVGTMLIEHGTHMPESLVVGTERYSEGWSCIVKSTSAQLGKAIESAGWTFFYLAGEIQTRGFGFNDQSRMDRAVAHLIRAVKLQHCNCLEITGMRRRSFLGLSFTSLSAHARHIQRSHAFHDASDVPTSHAPRPGYPVYTETATVRSKTLVAGEAAQTWENEGGAGAAESMPPT